MFARLNIALRGFTHPGARWTHLWDLQNFGALRPLLDQLPESGMLPSVGRALAADGLRELVAGGVRAALVDCLDRFDAVVRPALSGAATQVIHTDFHGENLLTDGGRVTGILDFGDALAGRWPWTSARRPAISWAPADRAATCSRPRLTWWPATTRSIPSPTLTWTWSPSSSWPASRRGSS
jgi:Ser/Thr protein kinase RdoA (MazF antagonist)